MRNEIIKAVLNFERQKEKPGHLAILGDHFLLPALGFVRQGDYWVLSKDNVAKAANIIKSRAIVLLHRTRSRKQRLVLRKRQYDVSR